MPSDPILVFVKKEKMPTLKLWNEACKKQGLSLQLKGFNPKQSFGFMQQTFDDQPCGFEYDIEKAEPYHLDSPELKTGDFTHVVMFTPPFDLQCILSAAVAAATLNSIVDGLLEDNLSATRQFATGKDAINWVKQLISEEGRQTIKNNFGSLLIR